MKFAHMIIKYSVITQEKTRHASTAIREAVIFYCRDQRLTHIESIEEHAEVSSFKTYGTYNRAKLPDFRLSLLWSWGLCSSELFHG